MADDKIQASLEQLAKRLNELENISSGYRNYVNFNSDAIRDLSAQFNSVANNQAQLQQIVTQGTQSGGGSSQTGGTSINNQPTGSGTYQITTDTNFSIPILYGQAQVRGAVIDAALTNSNANLVTAIVLSEVTGGGSVYTGNADYTLNHVYFNDAELILEANGKVNSAILNDGTVSNKYNENTQVFLYEQTDWNPLSSFYGTTTPSYGGATAKMPHWEQSSHWTDGLVLAIIDQKYDAANGVQGLGTWTFDITNDTAGTNPGEIVYDYIKSGRYGAGYPNVSIDIDSFVGNTSTSLKNISNTEFLYTTTISADANMSAVDQITTTGNINTLTNVAIMNNGVSDTVTANLFAAGNIGGVVGNSYNRFKIFWANTSGFEYNVVDTPLYSNNTLLGFLDVARSTPDGADAAYPGDTDANGTPTYAPNAAITNFLTEGDKIRPEGSRYIYTVASNVDVPSPGYEAFEIPVRERVFFPDISVWANANANINAVGSDPTVAWTQDPDINFVTYQTGWPFANATASGATTYPNQYDVHANLVFTNCLVGNAVFTTLNESLGGNTYIGTEPKAAINGLLDTSRSVRENINELMKHSFAQLTYDNREGKWKAVPDGNTDTAGAFLFSDENILSELTVATSDVANFFNASRATYVEKTHNSVNEDVIVYTPDFDKNANEGTYIMEQSYPLTNSGSEATRKADELLRQNRKDLVVDFVADYSAIVVDPGDLVKLTNDSYGFDEKLFKVIQNEHSMEGDIITCKLSMIEWDLGVFTPRIPFRKPVLDDIAFEPETYDDLVDAGGIDPDSYPANSIHGNALVDGSVDFCDKIDLTSICANSIPGNAIIGNSMPGASIEDGSVPLGKLGFTPAIVDSLVVAPYYYATRPLASQNTIYIVQGGGGAQGQPSNIEFYCEESGLYTFSFKFANPWGHQDIQWNTNGTGHDHVIPAGGTVSVETATAYGGSANGNVLINLSANGAPLAPTLSRPGTVGTYANVLEAPSIISNVEMEFYHVNSGGLVKTQKYQVVQYGGAGGPVELNFTLNLLGGYTARCKEWRALYRNFGVPSRSMTFNYPVNGGIDPTGSLNMPLDNAYIYVLNPTVTMTAAGNISLN